MKKIIMISIGIVLMTESLVPMKRFCSRDLSRFSATLTALSAIRQTHSQKAESPQTDKSSIAPKVLLAGMVVGGATWMEWDYRSRMQQNEQEQIRKDNEERECHERRAKRINKRVEFQNYIQEQCQEELRFPLVEGDDEKTVLSLIFVKKLISAYRQTTDEHLLSFLSNFVRIGHCFALVNKGTVTDICTKYGCAPIDYDNIKSQLKELNLNTSEEPDKNKQIVFARYFVADLWWTLYHGESVYFEEAPYSCEQRKEYFKFFELAMQSGLAELIQTRSLSTWLHIDKVIEQKFAGLRMKSEYYCCPQIQHLYCTDVSCALYQKNAGLPYFVCKRFGLPMEGYSFD